MKILMLLEVDFPPDSRVEKEMIALSEAGHDVFLACITHSKDNCSPKKKQHYTVYRKYIGKRTFNKLCVTPLILPFYHRWWKSFANKIYREIKFDVIHVHDLPLSKVGFFFKKKYGTKLVCDQHEFYSDWIKDTAHMNTVLGKIVSAFSNWESYEKKYLTLADFVITVADPLRENYIRAYNIPNEKIVTILNTPTAKVFNKNNVSDEIVSKYSKDFVIFYAGVLDILRGVNTAILALPEIKKVIPNVKLVLGGRFAKEYTPFKLAKKEGVENLISFVGWIDENQLPSYIVASKICFFTPPSDRDEINKTIATKMYQYAVMGRPIITSDAEMMKEFVEQNALGVSIESNNSSQFAEAVISLSKENDQYSKKAVSAWYWEETILPMLQWYQKVDTSSHHLNC